MIRRLLFIILLFTPSYAQDSLYFVIRVDDIQSRNTTYMPRSINSFQAAVEQRGGKVTWLVMPHRLIESQNADGVLLNEIKQSLKHGHEAALHGYNHTCLFCGETGHEMFCSKNSRHLTYQQQAGLIDSSLKLFADSIKVTPVTFVPPGHYDDTTTWQVLLDKGFKYISTNGPKKDFVYKNLFNLLRHKEYTWDMTQTNYKTNLTTALADIRTAARDDGFFCLLLHDPFIRQGYSKGIVVKWIGELLDSVKLQFNNKIKFATISETAEHYRNLLTGAREGLIANIPNGFALEQNYPNPFNPSTTVNYTIPSACSAESAGGRKVFLAVYNTLGQRVSVLVNEEKAPGSYSAVWNSGVNPSGIYLYEFICGNKRIVKKMTLMK